MRIVIKKAGEFPEIKDIPNKLSALQEIVGGYIECVKITEGILCVCNEEGKLKGLKPNFIFGNDVIVGDVFFCSEDRCDFNSLTDADIDWLMNVLNKIEMIKRDIREN